MIIALLFAGCDSMDKDAPLAVSEKHAPVSDICTTPTGPCALLKDGHIACWARGAPFSMDAGAAEGTLRCGSDHVCFEANGFVECLSFDNGNPGSDSIPPDASAPTESWWLNPYWGVGGCGILADSRLMCWSSSDPHVRDDSAVDVGFSNACHFSLDLAGEIHGWAVWESCGQAEWQDDVYGLDEIPPGPWASVEGGRNHACALDAEGYPTCWGNYGSVGTPPEGERFKKLSLGDRTTCGVTTDGYVRCWADESLFGDSDGETMSWVADKVPTTTGWTQVAVASSAPYACAVDAEGQVTCFGNELPYPTIFDALANPVDTQPDPDEYWP